MSRVRPRPPAPVGCLWSRLRIWLADRGALLWTSGALLTSQVLMALAGVVAARALGPSGKGIVTGVLVWPTVLSALALIGIPAALSVRVAASPSANLPTALGAALAHALGVGVTLALVARVIVPATLANLGASAPDIERWVVVVIPAGMLGESLMSVNLALGRLRRYNLCRIAGPTLLFLLTLLLWAAGGLTPARVVAATVAGGVLSLGLAACRLPWRSLGLDLRQTVADLRFGAKVSAASWLGLANLRLDVLLMSAFVPSAVLGYYGVANNAMIPVTVISASASVLLVPATARANQSYDAGDSASEAPVALVAAEARRSLILAAVGGAVLAAAAPVAIPLVFGAAFRPAIVLIWILIPGFVARAYAGTVAAGAVGLRRPRVGNLSEAAAFLVTIVLLPFLLPRFEAIGAAVTSTLAYITSAVVAVVVLVALPPAPVPAVRPSQEINCV